MLRAFLCVCYAQQLDTALGVPAIATAENAALLFTTLGFLSGSMGVLTGINGPQIVLGLANQGYDGTFIRRCMITYLIVIDFVYCGHIYFEVRESREVETNYSGYNAFRWNNLRFGISCRGGRGF
ncbi:MAG: hypothetical protein U9O85_08960 [Euryarchaeota archaeon]|nr:hypothetical protein [Euryarchaeota archaeon]